MFGRLTGWKAPGIRVILIAGAFFLFTPSSWSQYNFDANCQQAYEAILSLRFTEANNLIAHEKREQPDNLIPVYLENLMDFLTIIIGEERQVYDQLREKRSAIVRTLEMGREDSPYHNFCLGEVHLQWAFARLKFGDYASAALDIHKAYTLYAENESKYPSFIINKMGMGIVHVVLSLVPDNFKWVGNLVGLHGSMDLGMREIRQVATYAGSDRITGLYRSQASFFLVFLTVNLQKNKKDALSILPLLKSQPNHDRNSTSPLLIYARSSVLMKNGLNDEALEVLRERVPLTKTFPFCYLDYLEGVARLNKLDDSAGFYFEKFISGFHGRNYIRSAYQKLAWIALLEGDTAGYHRNIHLVSSVGASVVDEDKQAENESLNGPMPNLVLLRSRLLFDGGYFQKALGELLNHPVKTTVRVKRDLVEYTYRLGRIYHETGNLVKAIENYQQTVLLGRSEPFYFAAGAAFQLGLLYENKGDYSKAESAYQLCLSINTPEYKTSLHQKAKAGLNRLKKQPSKT